LRIDRKDDLMTKSNENSILFSPICIGRVEIPNRFVRSATHEFMAEDDGTPTERHLQLFARLAEGEVGLIITGHAYVQPVGKASPKQTGIYHDRLIEGLSKIPAAVHRFKSKIFVQLAHAGRQTKERICEGMPIAPSPVYEPVAKTMPREMTGADIKRLIADFIQGGRRAKAAGFDGVQLHVAHGYLLSCFLSLYTNRRTDDWGGSTGNRVKVVNEIIQGLKAANGGDYPVIAKWNSSDFLKNGLELEESVEMAARAETAGLDGIEVSGGSSESGKGSMWPGLRPEEDEGYFVESAARFRRNLRIPVIGLGGNRTFSVMERFVTAGRVDMVALSRPLIREPYLVRRFRLGEVSKSECISCNKCFNPRGISCAELRHTA
jgi:2,4-dienoyl-CoA reductase-like NADH-dependent reductase (Old Yellow Enzyme family)